MMSSWLLADLTALSAAPPTGGNPSSQVISENGQSLVQVVYTAVDNHLYELRLEPGQSWKATDLTALSGAPDASSNPFAFNFGSLRVYFRAQDFHLHELRLEPRQPWQAADLTALTNTPDAAEGEPFAYNAFPGESMSIEVLYRARDSHLYKLSQGFQQPWSVLDVTASSGALNAAGSPFASVTNIRSSRPTSRIIYRGVDNHLHEIRLERQAWKAADLTADSGASDVVGDPRACVVWKPLQDMARVVFHAADHHLHELRLAISNSD